MDYESEDHQLPFAIKTEEIEIISELPPEESEPSQSLEVINSNKFKCYICTSSGVPLENKDSFRDHLKYAHTVKAKETYHCGECNWSTHRIKLFNKHLARHDSTRPYKCSFCTIRFTLKQKCKQHEIAVHNVGQTEKLRCFICITEVELETNECLQEHLASAHLAQENYTCIECNWSSDEIASFNQHLSKHDTSTRPYECSICPKRFTTGQRCKKHEATVHGAECEGVKPYNCSKCEMKFIYKSILKKHELTEHGIVDKSKASEENIEIKMFRCYICDTRVLLANRECLEQHLTTDHSTKEVYHCGECTFYTDNIVIFNDHLIRHDADIRPYKCSYCSSRFMFLNRRNFHEARLHGVDHGIAKKYCCATCGRAFFHLSRLNQHARTHSKNDELKKEKNKCYLCQTSIVLDCQKALQQHLTETHELKDRYHCNKCSYRTKTIAVMI